MSDNTSTQAAEGLYRCRCGRAQPCRHHGLEEPATVNASEGTVRVTVEGDGDRDDLTLGPTGYLVVCGAGMAVSTETLYRNGTVVLTIKPTEEHTDG